MKEHPAPSSPSAKRDVLRRTLRLGRDSGIYAFGVVFGALAIMNVPGTVERLGDEPQITEFGVAAYLAYLLAWGSVFFRHRSAWAPLVAGTILAVVGTDYLLLLIGAHGALLVWPVRRRRPLMIVVSVLVAGFVLREIFSPMGDLGQIASQFGGSDPANQSATSAMVILLAVFSLLVCFGSAMLIRARRDSLTQRDRADSERDRASDLSHQLDRQLERDRLARDIHDALAHRLSVISLQSGALEEATRSRDSTVAKAAVTLRQQAHASLDDLRGLLGELRREPSSRDDDAAAPPSMASMRAIGHLIRSLREGGASVDAFVLIEDAQDAGAALDRTVYRIVQESLTNALKHAPGAPIDVYIEAGAASGVRIRVSNRLVPGRPEMAPGASRGLTGIQERAQLLGGTAWIGETEGEFLIDVSLPWPDRG